MLGPETTLFLILSAIFAMNWLVPLVYQKGAIRVRTQDKTNRK